MLYTFTVRTILIIGFIASGPAAADCLTDDSTESDFPDSLVSTNNGTGIQNAWYDDATDRYDHGVLGDAIEPSSLIVSDHNGCTYSVALDQSHVFEDLAPRLADIDESTGAEVITVRSHQEYGAQLAIYQLADKELNLLTTTPYIGTSNRWLAPIGIADLNNDGNMDIAYVDRPHLAKKLRVWSYRDGELYHVTSKAGYSNHRIGENFISGGLKICNHKVTMITADASWDRIIETTLEGDKLISTDAGAFEGINTLNAALLCESD